ncbi:hypothetical protein KKD62_03185 [Patescibacteria group bacterium]|nr:hypothetical protein [Patescibacteria group bacterium]MBU1931533.1 hypothetical protein [Patescibacteria group bacterium]
MTAEDYLKNRLKNCSSYILNDADKAFLKNHGVEAFVYKKLTWKKFRKWKLESECIERTKKTIHLALSKNEPLKVVFPIGGYKLWRLASWPEVDWAEFFNIAYILEYLSPLAAVYKPGVIFSYYVHTLLMEKHDNLTTKEIKQYMVSFGALINFFKKHLPKNLKLEIWKDIDLYSRKEYFKTLDVVYAEVKKEYEFWSKEKQARYQRMAMLNLRWEGKQNWTTLSETEKKAKFKMAAVYEAAAPRLIKVQKQVKGSDKVLVFVNPTKEFIGIGSTRGSIVKPWIGVGVLEKRGQGFIDRILSPSQWQKVQNQNHKAVKTELIPLKNFKEIRVYPKRFNFSSSQV